MEVYAAATAQSRLTRSAASSTPCRNPGNSTTRSSFTSRATTAPAPKARCKGRPTKSPPSLRPSRIEYLVSMIDELGSDRTYNHYPIGWAHAMDAPFQWTKQVASHLGGTRNGLAVSGRSGSRRSGEIRTQFHHVIDIVPTDPGGGQHTGASAAQRDAAEADGGRQHGLHVRRREGADAAHDPVFRDDGQPRDLSRRLDGQHNAARLPWETLGAAPDPDDYPWELYNLADDFSQPRTSRRTTPRSFVDLQSRS